MLKQYYQWFNSLKDTRKETDPYLLFRFYAYLDSYSKENYFMPLIIEAKPHIWGIEVVSVQLSLNHDSTHDIDTAFKFITKELQSISDFHAIELVHQSKLWQDSFSKRKNILLSTELSLNEFNS